MAYQAKGATEHKLRTKQEVYEFAKCSVDFVHAIDTYFYVPNTGGNEPFKLYPYQKAALLQLAVNKRVIFRKSRQMGLTTLLMAYALMVALTRPNQRIILISIRESSGIKMLELVKFMYENLPKFLQVPVLNTVGRRIGSATKIVFANNSTIDVEASTEHAGRGTPASLVIFDEVAFQTHADEIWTSMQPTFAFTDGQAIMNSTPFGINNLYYRIYEKAIRGENNFIALKLHWTLHPRYDNAWYERQVRELGTRRASQELDCEFLNSGDPVLDIPTLQAMEVRFKAYNGKIPFATQQDGLGGYIMKKPKTGTNYVIGVDIATGTSRDCSTFSIIEVSTRTEVCYWKGKLQMGDFCEFVLIMAERYNFAMIAPENNGLGAGFIEMVLKSGYTNVYKPNPKVKPTNAMIKYVVTEDKYGFNTNVGSRGLIIDKLNTALLQGKLRSINHHVVKEGFEFVYDNANRPVATSKLRQRASANSAYDVNNIGDDAIFALAIGNHIADEVAGQANVNALLST